MHIRKSKSSTVAFVLAATFFISIHGYSYSSDQKRSDDMTAIFQDVEKKVKVAGLLADADEALERDDLKKAETSAKEALKIDPANAEAKKVLAGVEKKIKEKKSPAISPQKSAEKKTNILKDIFGVSSPAKDGGDKKTRPSETKDVKKDAEKKTIVSKKEEAVSPRKKVMPVESEKTEITSLVKETSKKETAPPVQKPVRKEEPLRTKIEAGPAKEMKPAAKVEKKVGIIGRILRFFQWGKKTEQPVKPQAEKVQTAKETPKPGPSEKMKKDEINKKQAAEAAKKDVEKAKKYLDKADFSGARGAVEKARAKDPKNREALALNRTIDKTEIFTERRQMEENRPKELAASQKAVVKDPYKANQETKSIVVKTLEAFNKPVHEINDVQSGKTYTIDECVQLALHRSPRLIVSDKQMKLSETRVLEAYRDLLPSFSAKYEVSSGRIGANSMVRHYRGNKYGFEVKQVVLDGMEKWFALRQSKANLDIVRLEKKKIENEIVEETKKAYYSLDKTIKALRIQNKTKEEINKCYDIIDKAYQEELVSKAEYLKAKSQNLQSNFQCISSEEDMKLAEMVLFQAMHMEPGNSIQIKPVESPKTTLSIGLENCYQLATANRPELLIKAKVIEYYNFERKMKKAKGWPKMEFNGSFGAAYENYEPLNDITDQISDGSGPSRDGRQMEPEWYAGVKTSLPVWGNTVEHNYVKEQWAPTVSAFRGTQSATNYFTYKFLDDLSYFSDIQEAQVGFERANYEYEKEKQDMMVQVKEMYFQYRKSMLQMDIAKAQMEYQTTFVEVSKERQRLGDMEMTTVMEEYVKLAEYEYAVVQADTDYYISLAGLNKSVGVIDCFKPEYEDKEYREWKKAQERKKREEEQAKIEAKKTAKERGVWGLWKNNDKKKAQVKAPEKTQKTAMNFSKDSKVTTREVPEKKGALAAKDPGGAVTAGNK